MEDRFDNARFRYGSAQFANEAMIEAAGAFRQTPDSHFAGFFNGKILNYTGLAGGIIVAGPRAGKMTSWLAYNICPGFAKQNRIMLDMKGEGHFIGNLQVLERRKSYTWNPSNIPGAPSHRVNPVDYIHIDSPELHDDIIGFCEMYIPLSGSSGARFFELRGRGVLFNLCMLLVELDRVLRLDRLYWVVKHFIADSFEWNEDFLPHLKRSRFNELVLFDDELDGLRKRAGNGFEGICGELAKCFAHLASPTLRRSVSPPYDFSFSQLCEQDQLFDVKLCPLEPYVKAWAPVIKCMFLAAKTYRSRRPEAPRQVWLIDEAAQLSSADFILKAYTIGAGAWGVTPFTVWQSTYQMKSLGPDAENILTTSAGLQIYFGMRDLPSAKSLSQRIGSETLEYDDTQQQGRHEKAQTQALLALLGEEEGGLVRSLVVADHHKRLKKLQSKQHRLVRTPDEILTMPTNKMFVFMDGIAGAIYADRIPYYKVPWMAGRYLGNPYHPPLDRVNLTTRSGSIIRRVITEDVPIHYSHYPQYAQSGQWSYVEGFKPCQI